MIPRLHRRGYDDPPPRAQFVAFYPLGLGWTHGVDYQVDLSVFGHRRSVQSDYRYWTRHMRLELLLGHGFRMRDLIAMDARACALHEADDEMAGNEMADNSHDEEEK